METHQKKGFKDLLADKQARTALIVVVLFLATLGYFFVRKNSKNEASSGAEVMNSSAPLADSTTTNGLASKSALEARSEAIAMQGPGAEGTVPVESPSEVEESREVPRNLNEYMYKRQQPSEDEQMLKELDPDRPASNKPTSKGKRKLARSSSAYDMYESDDEESEEDVNPKERIEAMKKQQRLMKLLEEYKKDKDDKKKYADKDKKISRSEQQSISSLDSPARRNANGFYGLYSDEQKKNIEINDDSLKTVRAVIHKNQKIMDGGRVQLRLLEPIKVGAREVPKGTMIFGTCGFGPERLNIKITSIQLEGKIIPVTIRTYDMDGMEGIYIANAFTVQQLNRTTGQVVQQGLNFPIGAAARSTEGIIAAQAAQATVNGVSRYIQRKALMQKATLKDNYIVLLR